MSSGFNVNSEIGNIALGKISVSPFEIAEMLIKLGPLAKRNIDQIGIQPTTDTEEFWWSNEVTGYSQDNVIWAANLMAGWVMSVFPDKENSYMRRWTLWAAATPQRYLLVRSLPSMMYISQGFTSVFPDHPYAKFWRGLTGMSADLTLSGVR